MVICKLDRGSHAAEVRASGAASEKGYAEARTRSPGKCGRLNRAHLLIRRNILNKLLAKLCPLS